MTRTMTKTMTRTMTRIMPRAALVLLSLSVAIPAVALPATPGLASAQTPALRPAPLPVAQKQRARQRQDGRKIACRPTGCVRIPAGCHPVTEYDFWGNPTGYDAIVCPGR